VMANTCASSSCVTTLGGGFRDPFGVAVDGSGNVYVVDNGKNAVTVMANTCASSSCVTTLGGGFRDPFGVAVDGSGNVYVADAGHSAIEVMANTCASSSCVTTLGGGFSYPHGVAVDGSGNVYVADIYNSAIEVMANTCASSSCVTTLGGGFNYAFGVAVDGSGNVYVADYNNSAVKEIPLATPPGVSFATATPDGSTDSTDGPQAVTVANDGNAPLEFSPTPSISTGFNLGTESTSCTQLASLTLDAGGTCTLTATFAPVSPQSGSVSGDITLTDNNLNASSAQQSVALSGIAQAPPPTITGISPASGPAAGGTSITITGTNFTGVTAVTFSGCTNSAASANYAFFNSTTIYAFTPAATSAIPCTAAVTVTTSGQSNSGSFIYYDPVSTTNSTLTVSPSPAVAGSSPTITVTLVDANSNPIDGATAAFTSTSSTVTFGTPSVSGNVITATITDTAVENAPISVALSGTAYGTLTGSEQFVAPAFVVTTLTDPASGNGTPGNCIATGLSGDNSNCSLRDAVAAANALGGVTANIGFAPALTAGATAANPAIIAIAQSTPITMNANMNINGPGVNLLTIEGGVAPYNGTTQTSNYQVFAQTGGTILLSGVTVANGYTPSYGGGGLYQTVGTLTVSNSTFSGNSAPNGSSCGGAIRSSGALTLANSSFVGNSANFFGGAIFAQGSLTISGSTFSGNSAGIKGGAIWMNLIGSSSENVSSSTFLNNSAAYEGGAIYVTTENGQSVTLNVSNSTFSGNSATEAGAQGGAILTVNGATLQASNSIFTNNSAPASGGAIFADNGAAVAYSIFYGNTASNSNDCAGCSFTNEITTNPNLGPLGNYGGPTQTMLPLPGSSAICAGVSESLNSTPIAADQRGVSIPTTYGNTQCYDIGAVQTSYSALAFVQQPSNAKVNAAITPPVTVSVTENGLKAAGIPVPLTLKTNGAGTLAGTTTETTTASSSSPTVATYSNLSVSGAATTNSLSAALTIFPGYSLTAASNNFVVTAVTVNPTITFTTAASYAYGQTFQLAATSNSTGAFTYSLVSGPATVTTTGSVHITGVGPVVVQATEAAAGNYNSGSKQASFKAVQASQTITFTTKAPASAVNGTSFTVAATAGSGLPVTFTSSGVCTNSGAKYTMTSGTGTCSVIANQAGNTDYSAAPQVTEGVKASPATVPTPLFTASTGTFTTTNTITISDSLAGTTIYYTMNGTTPSTSSTKYTGPITISSNATIKAIAYKSGYTQSAVATATYTITKTVPTPTFTPAAGTYTKAQTVTIKDLTIGVTIYYTTNGQMPTTSSTKYTGPITVSGSETIKALGTASGYAPSAIATAKYTITK
jgi:predicted outer membrane repeat protein